MNDQAPTPTFWKKCSSCKKEIAFGSPYYLCSVSTCRHKRTGLRFCSVGCWDAHLGYANHRSSFAEETRAPSKSEYERILAEDPDERPREPVKKIIEASAATTSIPAATRPATTAFPSTEVLVVVSKVKQLIKDQSEFNTSACCIDALTKKVVKECLSAIEHARAAGRKTVMGRDVL